MTIGKIRTLLYGAAKYLGDINAVIRAIKAKSVKPIMRRVYNRTLGKVLGRLFKSKRL